MDEGLSVSELLEQIRSAFQHEISFSGPLVALDRPPAEQAAHNPDLVVAADSVQPPTIMSSTPKSTASAPTSAATLTPASAPTPAVAASRSYDQGSSSPHPTATKTGGGDEYVRDIATADRFEALIPAGSPLRSFASLSEVEAWVASTVLIPLDKSRLNPVFGVGNPDADLMVIGEAPGADEDKQGEPFVGRAGQLLTQILAAIGFQRGDVYIANILKSRPPRNRDPLAAEIEAHIPILYKQIALIRPRVILCVGKTAGNSLLGVSTSLKSLRGTFHDYHGVPVMVTYHPAALLRNPEWKRPTWEDVQKLRATYDRLTGTEA